MGMGIDNIEKKFPIMFVFVQSPYILEIFVEISVECKNAESPKGTIVRMCPKTISTVIQKRFEISTEVQQSSGCPSLSLCGLTGICRTGAWVTGSELYSGGGFSWHGVKWYHLLLPSVSYSVITKESSAAEERVPTVMPPGLFSNSGTSLSSRRLEHYV